MQELISLAAIERHAPGTPLLLGKNALVTPAARELAARRGIELRQDPAAPGEAESPASAASCGCAAPAPAPRQPPSKVATWTSLPRCSSIQVEVFRDLVQRKPGSSPARPAIPATSAPRVTLAAHGSSPRSLGTLLSLLGSHGLTVVQIHSGAAGGGGWLAAIEVEYAGGGAAADPARLPAELAARGLPDDVRLVPKG